MRVQESAELVAIDVYQRAEKIGQRITLAMVERRVAELLGHAPACRCRLCGAAAKVRVRDVHRIAVNCGRAPSRPPGAGRCADQIAPRW